MHAFATRSLHLTSSRLEWAWDDALLLPDPRLHTTTTSLLRIVLVCCSVLFATVWRRVGGIATKRTRCCCHLNCARLPCHSPAPTHTQTPLVVNYVTRSIVATCALVPSATNTMMMCRRGGCTGHTFEACGSWLIASVSFSDNTFTHCDIARAAHLALVNSQHKSPSSRDV